MDEKPDKLTDHVLKGDTLYLFGEQRIEEYWIGPDGCEYRRVTMVGPPLRINAPE